MSQHRTGADGTGAEQRGADGPRGGGADAGGAGGAPAADALPERRTEAFPDHDALSERRTDVFPDYDALREHEAEAFPAADALPEYAERVLDVAELIPPGRVMTYGDIAEWLGDGGPRQVGRVMALYGGAVPWWRVVRADGTLLPGHELRALDHYREENTPLREASRGAEGHLSRLDMRRARWDGAIGGADAGEDGNGGAHI